MKREHYYTQNMSISDVLRLHIEKTTEMQEKGSAKHVNIFITWKSDSIVVIMQEMVTIKQT